MIQIQRLSFVLLCLAAFGCGSSTSPSGRNSLTVTGATPTTGANITLPAQFFNTQGAAILPRGSGLFSVTVNLEAAHDIPWSELNVYLLTGGTRRSVLRAESSRFADLAVLDKRLEDIGHRQRLPSVSGALRRDRISGDVAHAKQWKPDATVGLRNHRR